MSFQMSSAVRLGLEDGRVAALLMRKRRSGNGRFLTLAAWFLKYTSRNLDLVKRFLRPPFPKQIRVLAHGTHARQRRGGTAGSIPHGTLCEQDVL